MGANLFLIEEEIDGAVKSLIEEEKEWIGRWFLKIKPWSPEVVDNERLTWINCYGVPCHAWSFEFFDFITCSWGKFASLDDDTLE